jgi:hypothetical protein
VSEAHFSIMH